MTKKLFILSFFIILFTGWLCPDEAVLIDFSLLQADMRVPRFSNDPETRPNEHSHTLSTFSRPSGITFQSSLAIGNFVVQTDMDGDYPPNWVSDRYTTESPSRQWGTVMGSRIYFPIGILGQQGRIPDRQATAFIRPPFIIPLDDPRFENGYGLLKREGGIRIRSIYFNVYSSNYRNVLASISLLDGQGNEHVFFMGLLDFDGWRRLGWNNPNYIQEVVNDRGYYDSLRFGSILIDREEGTERGFTLYFKDIVIIYDEEYIE